MVIFMFKDLHKLEKTKKLEKVNGGGVPGTFYGDCHHRGSYVDWHSGSLAGNPFGGSTQDCVNCAHWIRPDGPCELD